MLQADSTLDLDIADSPLRSPSMHAPSQSFSLPLCEKKTIKSQHSQTLIPPKRNREARRKTLHIMQPAQWNIETLAGGKDPLYILCSFEKRKHLPLSGALTFIYHGTLGTSRIDRWSEMAHVDRRGIAIVQTGLVRAVRVDFIFLVGGVEADVLVSDDLA